MKRILICPLSEDELPISAGADVFLNDTPQEVLDTVDPRCWPISFFQVSAVDSVAC